MSIVQHTDRYFLQNLDHSPSKFPVTRILTYTEISNNYDALEIQRIRESYVHIYVHLFSLSTLLSADDCGITDPTAYSNRSVQ